MKRGPKNEIKMGPNFLLGLKNWVDYYRLFPISLSLSFSLSSFPLRRREFAAAVRNLRCIFDLTVEDSAWEGYFF